MQSERNAKKKKKVLLFKEHDPVTALYVAHRQTVRIIFGGQCLQYSNTVCLDLGTDEKFKVISTISFSEKHAHSQQQPQPLTPGKTQL